MYVFDSFRTTFNIIFWLVLFIVSLGIGIYTCVSNYLSCSSALSRMNVEQMPLVADKLLGPILGSFFGQANLVSFLSLLISCTLAVSFFVLVHLLYSVPSHLGNEVGIISKREGGSASSRSSELYKTLVKLLVFSIPMYWALTWDVSLFRYRSVADLMSIEDPEIAVSTIPTWEIYRDEHPGLFSTQLVDIGAYGYIAFTILACLVLEEALSRLHHGFSTLFESDFENDLEFVETEVIQTHEGDDA